VIHREIKQEGERGGKRGWLYGRMKVKEDGVQVTCWKRKLLPRRVRDASLLRGDEEGDTRRRERTKPGPLRERLSFKGICYPRPVQMGTSREGGRVTAGEEKGDIRKGSHWLYEAGHGLAARRAFVQLSRSGWHRTSKVDGPGYDLRSAGGS